MSTQLTSNFVRQQGFPDAPADTCGTRFRALNFQPRVVGPLAVLAVVLQSAPLFLALSALSWWGALRPRLSPFDAVYNRLFAGSDPAARLTPAPGPRRFSMGMAGSFMLGIGISLMAGWTTLAAVLQAFLLVALAALILGRFCMGSYIYYLIRGNMSYANQTLPWARG